MKQLDSKYVWKLFLQGLLGSFIIFFVLGVIILASLPLDGYRMEALYWTALILSIAFLVSVFVIWIMAKLTYRFYWYGVQEEGFQKKSGIIWKSYVTIPYGRIQNVDIRRGIWDHILGLSRLHIQTAGYSHPYSSPEGKLPGLSVKIAEQLRDELIKRISNSKSSGGGV